MINFHSVRILSWPFLQCSLPDHGRLMALSRGPAWLPQSVLAECVCSSALEIGMLITLSAELFSSPQNRASKATQVENRCKHQENFRSAQNSSLIFAYLIRSDLKAPEDRFWQSIPQTRLSPIEAQSLKGESPMSLALDACPAIHDQRPVEKQVFRIHNRAIVMGGSMAGLAAARVLSDYFREVVLVERDHLGDIPEHRCGVPQGRHTHGLLASGRKIWESFFPGLFEDVLSAGAVKADMSRDAHWCFESCEHARCESGLEAVLVSRPLLEGMIRQRVRDLPNVLLWDGCQVKGLAANSDNSRIIGIQHDDGKLLSDLVVDATGGGSRSPQWLEAL